jgi:Ni/Co efflux regulator RcnB
MDQPAWRNIMQSPFRLSTLAGLLLLAATPFAGAETPMTDPVAPAVIGRPLDQIRPARAVRPKTAAAKPYRPKPVVAINKAAPKPVHAPAAAALPAVAQATPVPSPSASPAASPAPKQEREQVDPRAAVVDNVGQGSAVGMQPTAPGIFFGVKEEALVRRFYATQPASGKAPQWKIGEPVPARAAMKGVPDAVRAALPPVPPGHQYVQLDDDVVLVAVPSRMVVDGVSRKVQ